MVYELNYFQNWKKQLNYVEQYAINYTLHNVYQECYFLVTIFHVLILAYHKYDYTMVTETKYTFDFY